MEISRLPQLKNKNFLESQIRRFTKVKNIIDNIEDENYNKFDQIELIKKTNLLEQKKKNYLNNKSHLISLKSYFHKNKKNVIKKIENLLINKKLKQDKSTKYIFEYQNKIKDDLISPLNYKYKLLISNIDYNKRCFRNLSNKDFDSIFNDNSSWSQEPIKKHNISLPKKIKKKNKIKDIKNNLKNRNKNIFYSLSTVSNNYNNNYFINKKKLKTSKYKKINNFNKINYLIKTNNNQQNNSNKSNIKIINDYTNHFNNDKKYEKFVLLLKKQNDKNIKLLNDDKKQEIMNKDNLLVSIVKLKGYKPKKFHFN